MIAAHREQSGINNASSGVHGPGSLQGTLCLFFLFFRRCCLSSCINLQRPHDVEIQEFPLPKRDQLPAAVGHRMKRAAPPSLPAACAPGGSPLASPYVGSRRRAGSGPGCPRPPHPGWAPRAPPSKKRKWKCRRRFAAGQPRPTPTLPPPPYGPGREGYTGPHHHRPPPHSPKSTAANPRGCEEAEDQEKAEPPPPPIPGIPPLGGPGRAAGTCSSVWGCRSLCVCPPCPSPGTAFPYRRSGCGGEEKPGMQGPVVLGEGGRWVKAQGIWQRGNLKVPVTDRPPPPGDRRRREGSPPLGSRNGGPQRLRLPVTGHGAGPWPCTTAGRRSPSPGEGGRGH